eukprot:15396033-Heterocapsa_arctica.AAC.1
MCIRDRVEVPLQLGHVLAGYPARYVVLRRPALPDQIGGAQRGRPLEEQPARSTCSRTSTGRGTIRGG